MNNSMGAFKEERKKQTKKQVSKHKLFTYSTNCTWKVSPLQKARTSSFLKLEIASINIPLLDVFVLN